MLRAKVGIGVTLTAGLLVAVAAMGKPKPKQKPVGISKAAMGVKLSSSSAAKPKKLTIIPPTPNVQANITTVAAKARLLGLNVSDLESPVRLSMSSLSFRQGNAQGSGFHFYGCDLTQQR